MNKLIILLGLAAPLIYAQGDNTIFQQVLTNVPAANVGPSTLIRNIGQGYHLITWSTANSGALVCNPAIGWIGRAQLEGSFDNSNFVHIGQPISALQIGFPAVTWGWGAYPYLRINYISTSTANCALSASYSGTIPGAKNSPLFDGTIKNGLLTKEFTTVGAGDLAVFSCSTGAKASIYGIYLNNTAAATLTGVKIRLEDSTGIPVVLESFTVGSMATLTSYSMIKDTVPILGSNQYAANSATTPINIIATASAAGLQGWLQIRCE